ncbi:MAG TPA: arginine--tRNA ligase [Solirubrobacteraceae bacterium]
MNPLGDLHATVLEAAGALVGADGGTPPAAGLERPPQAAFGDYATNAALLLAPRLRRPPREVAESLGRELSSRLGDGLERVEVAGPGFLNVFLSDAWFERALGAVLSAGDDFGGGGAGRGERIDLEFISANPTGPLTVAHGRHAAYGDALGRILTFHGHAVTREFYVNDYGSQVRRLGESVRAWARGEAIPEDGYRGAYVGELVDRDRAASMDLDELCLEACAACLGMIRATLETFGVSFDTWVSERSLHDRGLVTAVLGRLAGQGDTYRSDGALWLRTTAYGDDKDRVLERSSGDHTYFTSDIAYHLDKLSRGFESLVDVWGADHHGYVRRMQAALRALGAEPDVLDVVILQFVHLIHAGERRAMGKRAGDFVTLDALIAEIGVDAARYFLVARSHDTTVDLDLDLAVRHTSENPVYYVQYAHARICGVLAKAGEGRLTQALATSAADGPLHPSERALLRRLVAFGREVAEAAERRAPHRIAVYSVDLAQDFTAFYRDCRIVGAEPVGTESFRLALAEATRRTIARALDLLGLSAPTAM